MLRVCIFDMDGLMLDTERLYLNAALKVSDKYNYGLNEDIIISTMGLNSIASHKRIIDVMGEDFPLDEYLKNLREEYYDILLNKEVAKKEGLIELLDYLDKQKIYKAVATSTSRFKAEALLTNANIIKRFDCIVCGDEIKNSKPDPEIYNKVLEKMKLSKDVAIVFEDSKNGLLSAYNAKIKCILIPDIAKVDDKMKSYAYRVLNNLKEAIDIIENTL